MNTEARDLRDHLEAAAECRRRGDHGGAHAAELAALTCLRVLLAPHSERGAA